jgi:hypothetical protein
VEAGSREEEGRRVAGGEGGMHREGGCTHMERRRGTRRRERAQLARIDAWRRERRMEKTMVSLLLLLPHLPTLLLLLRV